VITNAQRAAAQPAWRVAIADYSSEIGGFSRAEVLRFRRHERAARDLHPAACVVAAAVRR
jgi:hypothetical protein